MTVPLRAGSLRALARETIRSRIADEALLLFDERGFESTTVDEIAAAVGVSPRSFFRYFPTKEDVVIGDLVVAGTALRDDVAARVQSEGAWPAMHHAMREAGLQMDTEPDRWLRVMRVITGAASLRARNLEKHLTWSALLVPVIAEHVEPDQRLGDLATRTLVGAAFACLDAALTTWCEIDAAVSFVEVLDAAFDAAEPSGWGGS